jgi:hypothetical protein
MESIQQLLGPLVGDEAFFNIMATLVVTVWMWFKRKTRLDEVGDQRVQKAISCLEAGVMTTYQRYVKERKKLAEDGKLTEEEKREAREMAFSFARNYAFTNGINLVKELGADIIPCLIEKSVGGLKQECSGPQKVVYLESTTTTAPVVEPPVSPVVQ